MDTFEAGFPSRARVRLHHAFRNNPTFTVAGCGEQPNYRIMATLVTAGCSSIPFVRLAEDSEPRVGGHDVLLINSVTVRQR